MKQKALAGATLAAVALGSLALVYAMDKNDSPVWAFWLLGTLHGGAAAYNMTVNCK
jgi:4-amino-4-deoxy-L-arabinose transferase-like glycosyltransferase